MEIEYSSFMLGLSAGWGLLTVIELILRERRMRTRKYGNLQDLAAAWRNSARRYFYDSEGDESTITAKQAMVHDAIILLNCATELTDLVRESVEWGKEIK